MITRQVSSAKETNNINNDGHVQRKRKGYKTKNKKLTLKSIYVNCRRNSTKKEPNRKAKKTKPERFIIHRIMRNNTSQEKRITRRIPQN